MDFHKKQEKFFLILPTILILPRQMCRLFFSLSLESEFYHHILTFEKTEKAILFKF